MSGDEGGVGPQRALVVGQDDARGLLAAVRSLHRAGWRVGACTPSRQSLVAVSRYVDDWHPLGDDAAGSVAAAVAVGGYAVVLPGGDEELLTLSERRDRLGCVFPYGSRASVRSALDKVSLASAAPQFGLTTPSTWLVGPGDLDDVEDPLVLKSRTHALGRQDTLVSDDPEELRETAEAMLQDGAQPIAQELVEGSLVAVSLVLGPDSRVLASSQQRALALWPPDAGVTTRGRTEPVDPDLVDRLARFLAHLGWAGLAELQFLDTADGLQLIDINGRCYGSLALAESAGAELVTAWVHAFTGRPVPSSRVRAGERYQWLYGDLRRALREREGLVQTVRYALTARHSVLALRDPRPALSYLAHLARSRVQK